MVWFEGQASFFQLFFFPIFFTILICKRPISSKPPRLILFIIVLPQFHPFMLIHISSTQFIIPVILSHPSSLPHQASFFQLLLYPLFFTILICMRPISSKPPHLVLFVTVLIRDHPFTLILKSSSQLIIPVILTLPFS